MKRIFFGALLCSLAGCSSTDPGSSTTEQLGDSQQELNGALSPTGFLVGGGVPFYNTFSKNLSSQVEADRIQDTNNYYDRVGASKTGGGSNIRTALGTLTAFRSNFNFDLGETVTRYFNRGDLGIGREMHCRKNVDNQVACYVTNYSAGKANVDGALNQFTFGFSKDIAFANMEAGTPFATVAMVYRPAAAATANKIIFIVYDAAGQLQPFAALDRHAINFVDKGLGTPGVNLNNHVPTNCLNCHGGSYTSGASPNVQTSAFLPFDLDQFDYKPSSGFSRDESKFRGLNQLVRDVAVGVENASLTSQLDAWYSNNGNPTLPAVDFNGNGIVAGWQGAASVYQTVVRPSCRGCHMTSLVRFDSASDFLTKAETIAAQVKNHIMPHALQTQRIFWQSGRPAALANYFKANGHQGAGDDVATGSPTNIVTLDPHLIPSLL